METHPEIDLVGYARRALNAVESREVEAHLATCVACAAAYARLAGPEVAEVAPPANLGDALMRRIEGPDRFAAVRAALGDFFCWDESRLADAIAALHSPESWQPMPVEGIRVLPVEAGLGAPRGEALLGWMDRGATYPHHVNDRHELLLILQGMLRDSNGRELRRGDVGEFPIGTTHSVTSVGSVACLCAVLFLEGPADPT